MSLLPSREETLNFFTLSIIKLERLVGRKRNRRDVQRQSFRPKFTVPRRGRAVVGAPADAVPRNRSKKHGRGVGVGRRSDRRRLAVSLGLANLLRVLRQARLRLPFAIRTLRSVGIFFVPPPRPAQSR
jgi:hypothetical protein